jgi:hypothetical protein
MSAKYAAMEDQFIKISDDKKGDFVYKMTGAEKLCLDNYMFARNNALLFAKGSVNAEGNSTLHDDIGREVVGAESKEFAPLFSNR